MNKWVLLGAITVTLLLIWEIPYFNSHLHSSYLIMIAFFAIQAFVLFRIDGLIPEALQVHGSLVKIIIRFLSSAVFILIMIYRYDDPVIMVVQFIALYLVYMVFEIGVALTNLRRN